jgi:hypothetical protein
MIASFQILPNSSIITPYEITEETSLNNPSEKENITVSLCTVNLKRTGEDVVIPDPIQMS